MSPRLAYVIAFVLTLASSESLLAVGGTGASEINEGQISRIYYVNTTTGNDSYNGLSATFTGGSTGPFKSVKKGIETAGSFHASNTVGTGVKVLIAPGVYREGAAGNTNVPIIDFPETTHALPFVVEGQGWTAGTNTGDVILTGSEDWSGSWTDEGGGIFSKPWVYNWGLGPTAGAANTPDEIRRFEMVHVNGQMYYQMASGAGDSDTNNLYSTDGIFWVDEAANKIYVKPAASSGLATLSAFNAALVEVTTRGALMYHWRLNSQAANPQAIAFRNLVIKHFASGLATRHPVYFQNVNGLIVDDCQFIGNKQCAVEISSRSRNVTVRRCMFTNNGERAMGMQGQNLLLEDLIFETNARAAAACLYYGWSYGAFKLGGDPVFVSDGSTFRRIYAHDNHGVAIWFDTSVMNAEVYDSAMVANSAAGVFVENNNTNTVPGLGTNITVSVRHCYMAENFPKLDPTRQGKGFTWAESQNTLVENCLIVNNKLQLYTYNGVGASGRGPNGNNIIRNSVLSTTNSANHIYGVDGTVGWQVYFDGLSGTQNDNLYYSPSSTAFRDRNATLNQTLAGWQSLHLTNANNSNTDKAVDSRSQFLGAAWAGQPLVSLKPLASVQHENGGTVDAFIARRVAVDYSADLTINYTVSSGTGKAQNGVDFQSLSGSVTIPAGANTATISFTPIIDGAEADEIVELVITADNAYVAAKATNTFTLQDSSPAAPSGLVATGGNSGVSLAWTQSTSPGITQNSLYRSTNGSGGTYWFLTSLTAGTSYSDTMVVNGSTYYYVVTASSSDGESAPSAYSGATPQAPPDAPSGLTATALSASAISLAWVDNSANEHGFIVERSTNGSLYTEIATNGANVTAFTNSGLAGSTTYYYRVRGFNAGGDSFYSNVGSATTGSSTTTVVFTAVAAEDGWVLESNETSGVGGSINSSAATTSALRAGDDNKDRQYMTIVSFDTGSLPDGVTIVSATLKLKRGSVSGTNPFTTHGDCHVDMKAVAGFSGSTALETQDFQATPDGYQIATLSNAANDGDWSAGSLNSSGRNLVNKTGKTQFRVYFATADNDDGGNDYIGWYSSNDSTSPNRPVLEITY